MMEVVTANTVKQQDKEKVTESGNTATTNAAVDEKKLDNGLNIVAMGDEEEEDIPPDFFDDFSNQDFMEGLDVVDTWDDEMQDEGEVQDETNKNNEEEGKKTLKDQKNESTKTEMEQNKEEESKNVNRGNKHTRITFSKEREEREKRTLKHKNVERGPRYKDLREKIRRSEEKPTSEPKRRDPEKTRRDILRDKDRCAKDKEVKIINEKLKVVETGLVPPGMEMEVDLADIRSKQNSSKLESLSFKFDNSKSTVYASKIEQRPPIKMKLRSRSRSYERIRFRGPIISRSRSRSRERRRLRDNLSPVGRRRLKRTRSHSRSPNYDSRYRDKNYSRDRDRKVSSDRNTSRDRKSSRSKRRTRERDRSRSRSSNLSDRERWLTRRYKRSPSPRQRSISPDRKRLNYKKEGPRRSDPEQKEEKPSFLEEIHRKLNETSSSQVAVQHTMQLRTTYVPMQTPQSVSPASIPSAPQSQASFGSQIVPPLQYDQTISQYDQQFFIGTCDMSTVIPQPVTAPAPYVQPTPVPPPTISTLPILTSNPISLHSPNSDYSVAHLIEDNPLFPSSTKKEIEKKALEETDKKALAKLLEDKKISLSDFLTITARPSASRPINLQEKISVISRCQDAIRELGGDARTTGHLVIKRRHRQKTPERHHASPLRKIPIVRLNFTSLAKPEDDTGFSATLNRLLKSLGLLKEIEVEKTEKCQPSQKITRPRLPRRRNKPHVTAATQVVDATTPATHLMKMCQTDPYKCEVCEVRASRKFQDQIIQCEIKTYVDAFTQTVAEESSPLKNKSLSHMTPAEILAELEKKKKEETNKSVTESKNDIVDTIIIDDDLNRGANLQNKERSVELDLGDKNVESKKPLPKSQTSEYGNKRKNSFPSRKRSETSRGGGRGSRPPYFRASRGFSSFRSDLRKPCTEDLDVYSPNFDDDDDYGHIVSSYHHHYRSFDDDIYYSNDGPSHQRPFFEPPEHVRRKFNRRFL